MPPDKAPGFAELDALLDAALDLEPARRADWIGATCGSDRALCERLGNLIALAEESDAVLPPSGGLSGPVWEDVARELSGAVPALIVGHLLGRYEVRGLLGVGGMGRVYRAFDAALGREVAIKALEQPGHDDGSGTRTRFEREARVLATLNHPNVAAIYGFEQIDGAPYLILELVEGQTLAQRLEHGPLGVSTAIDLALQVALALEEAHACGIVHRDLKPANVKVDPQGRVKVLDFGIAKALFGAPAGATDVESVTATLTGAVLGTAPYMSPEQLRGQTVDTRTDVWAFGCLLYEMLCGRPAFRGASGPEVAASVLRDDVDWTCLPAATPPRARRVLRRSLRRDLRERLQSIGDARLDLAEASDDTPVLAPRAGTRRWSWPLVALLCALAAFVASRAARPASASHVVRLSLDLPADLALATDFADPFVISPDGSRVVVLATQNGTPRLFVRRLDQLEAVPLAGTEDAWQPFFSNDGHEIAFFAERKLKKVAVTGGPVLPIAEVGKNPRGASWGEDGTIVVAPSARSGLARVDPGRGTLAPLTQLDVARGEGSHRWPQILPGGQWVLFTASIGDTIFDEAHLELVSLASGERRRLIENGCHGRYAGGRLFFTHAGREYAVSFDLRTLRVEGTPRVVLEGVRYDPRSGATDFALSDDGTLVYTPAPPTSSESYLAWIDAAGALTRIGDAAREFREPRLSPDGRRVAVRIGTESASELWIFDTANGTSARVPFAGALHRPVWTADGHGITGAHEQDGRWSVLTLPAGGNGEPVTLFEGPHRVYADAWSADGRFLVLQELRPDTSWDLRLLQIGSDGKPVGPARDLAAMPYQERNASLSPDGRWVAYEADAPDAIAEIYVTSVANPQTTVRLPATTTARWPQWGAAGELYYWLPTGRPPKNGPATEGLQRVDWQPGVTPLAHRRTTPAWPDTLAIKGLPERLAVTPYAGYDLDRSRARPRFLALEAGTPAASAAPQRSVVVLDWFDDLRASESAR